MCPTDFTRQHVVSSATYFSQALPAGGQTPGGKVWGSCGRWQGEAPAFAHLSQQLETDAEGLRQTLGNLTWLSPRSAQRRGPLGSVEQV